MAHDLQVSASKMHIERLLRLCEGYIPQVPTLEIKGGRGHYQGAQGTTITTTSPCQLGRSFTLSCVVFLLFYWTHDGVAFLHSLCSK